MCCRQAGAQIGSVYLRLVADGEGMVGKLATESRAEERRKVARLTSRSTLLSEVASNASVDVLRVVIRSTEISARLEKHTNKQ